MIAITVVAAIAFDVGSVLLLLMLIMMVVVALILMQQLIQPFVTKILVR